MSCAPTPGVSRAPQGKCPTVGGRADSGFFHYPQLVNPRNSMSITNTKGLLNMPGQNNCFLNSAVQVLWHLDIFRRSFRELCGHACMEDSCIFCALKELFAQFQYSQESALPPDALRRALAETFCDQRRFQLGFMDDAAECFENILMRIHFHIANNESEDMCSAVHCIPHQKFAMTLVEQTVCHACGATSEPLPFTQMVHYVPTSALCSQAKLMKEKSDQMPSFSELLKKAGGIGDLRDCPSSCGAAIQIRKTLMNRPEIVSIGLVWDSERPTIEHIMDVFKTIGMFIKLQDVFHSVVDSRWASSATHQLVGIVTYYGKHYSTFFFHTKLRVWIYFDDAAVREIGPKWEQVVEKCCRGHFQPLLLLYANPHGSPVNTSTAPRVITVVPGHKKTINAKENSGDAEHNSCSQMFLHNTTNNQRRALTPNPEVSYDISANIQPRRAVTPSGELSWNDETVKDANSSSAKDNTYSSRNCNSYSIQPYNKISGDIHSQNLPDKNASLKTNKVSPRLSIPNCALYSDFPHKPHSACYSALNRPASVDDILKSGSNIAEMNKTYCQPGENTSPVSDEHSVDNTYISRKAVENVLQLQKLQRQRSVGTKGGHVFVGQRNSSSSLESLDNVFVFKDKSLNGPLTHKLDLPDVANLARRRDSGNWSGDRNSASSSSTTSLDNPYFYVLGNKRSNCPRSVGRPGEMFTDPGYDSFSLSSSDSYPSAVNSSPGKLGQIPEHVQTAFLPYDLSQLQYCLKDLNSNSHIPFGFKDECDKLCAEADVFVAKSIERENVGDISMAALLSETAAAKARTAMDVPYTSSQALAMAKMKYNMCLIRSSNLHKKLKEAESILQRNPNESSRDISDQNNAPQNNKNASDIYKKSKDASDSAPKKVVNESKSSNNSSEKENSPNDKKIEIYATLPKRSLKKKGALSSFVESLTAEESSDDKSSKDKSIKVNDELKNDKQTSNVSERSKMSNSKKKSHSPKLTAKDSDLSDYSSEWEHTKRPLYRTYSGPTDSKNKFSDMSTSNNQNLTENTNKKQHRIRRKLMGGFMRRKNRSLPDLREGQDSGSETARSYDDCFFAQTPVSCRKRQESKSTAENNHSESQKMNKTFPKENSKPKKNGLRAHTPPPYKPPPPITHSNSNLSPTSKKVIQVSIQDAAKMVIDQQHPSAAAGSLYKEEMKHKNSHLPLCHDVKGQRKVNPPFSQHNHGDLSSANAAWLKELQLKQEEINQRKRLQEEREKWLLDCQAGMNDKSYSTHINPENQKDCILVASKLDEKEVTIKTPPKNAPISSGINSKSDSGQPKSVRDLASKFEKVSVSEDDPQEQSSFSSMSPVHHHCSPVHTMPNSLDKKIYTVSPPLVCNTQDIRSYSVGQWNSAMVDKSLIKEHDSPVKSGKERLNGVTVASKQGYSGQSTSGSIHHPHLTDAQLTNVLRIGTNRSSFRNSNGHMDILQDDGFVRCPREVCGLHDIKRPDKPPDYETAIQRLELLRNDKNLGKFYVNNALSFEALLEQAKKRRGPKKSVTFSDKVVLVACAGDEDNDFIPNPLLERVYKQHIMQNSCTENSIGDSSMNPKASKESCTVESSPNEPKQSHQTPCNLCHKKTVETPNLYCPDCAFYMSRFQQK